jgi:hypothetical protein
MPNEFIIKNGFISKGDSIVDNEGPFNDSSSLITKLFT